MSASESSEKDLGRSPYRAVLALIFREMLTTYGRSPGGYAWLVLEPVAAIALLSVAFSLAFKAPSIGDNFPLFYATAYLPFAFFNDATLRLSNTILQTKSLLIFPSLSFIDALAARIILAVVVHVVVFAIIIAGLAMFLDARLILEPTKLLNAAGMVLLLALGIGTLNAFLFCVFPLWARLWSVITRPLFILSGIFFVLEDVPEHLHFVMLLNPIFHATSSMRDGFYPTYDAHYVQPAYPYLVGVVCLFFGLLLLYRHHDEIIWK